MANLTDTEIVAVETEFWTAIKARDGAGVARLTDDRCTIVGASGVTAVTGAAIAKAIASAPYEIKAFRIDPKTTRVVGLVDDCVLIAYAVHEEVETDGALVKLDAFDSSVWRRSDDGWKGLLHTESIAGDAFGRDRTARKPEGA
jgi:hypothetical protein